MYQFLLVVALFGSLAGCASTKSQHIVSDTPILEEAQTGLIVGATLPDKQGKVGSRVWFRNEQTGEIYGSAAGSSGYTDFRIFAMQVPPGQYTLRAMFVHNGDIGPIAPMPSFAVKPGQLTYVGTMYATWDRMATSRKRSNKLTKWRFGRLHCDYMGLACQRDGPVVSPKGRAEAPVFNLNVLDGGEPFESALREDYPSLPAWSMTPAALHK